MMIVMPITREFLEAAAENTFFENTRPGFLIFNYVADEMFAKITAEIPEMSGKIANKISVQIANEMSEEIAYNMFSFIGTFRDIPAEIVVKISDDFHVSCTLNKKQFFRQARGGSQITNW